MDKLSKLLNKLNIASNIIHKSGKNGLADHIVVGSQWVELFGRMERIADRKKKIKKILKRIK